MYQIKLDCADDNNKNAQVVILDQEFTSIDSAIYYLMTELNKYPVYQVHIELKEGFKFPTDNHSCEHVAMNFFTSEKKGGINIDLKGVKLTPSIVDTSVIKKDFCQKKKDGYCACNEKCGDFELTK